MDEHSDILLFILEWVWAPYGLLLMWTIRRLLGIEKKHGAMHTDLMVLKTNQQALGAKLELVDERNNEDHTKIEGKLDKHHSSVTARLDTLVTLARNGNGRK